MSPKLFSLDQVVLSKENSRVLIHLKHSLSFKTIAHGLADGGFNQSIKAACKQTQQLPTMLGVVACVLAVVCKRMQQLLTMLGPAVHRGKNTTPKSL